MVLLQILGDFEAVYTCLGSLDRLYNYLRIIKKSLTSHKPKIKFMYPYDRIQICDRYVEYIYTT
jgi:hypothetical protein